MCGTELFTNILQSIQFSNKQLLKRFDFIMGIMPCIFQVKLGLNSHQPAQLTLKIYYLSHLASERNNSMICLAAILTEHYFLMAFSQMIKQMAHKKNKNEFKKRCGLVTLCFAQARQFSNKTDDPRKLFTIIITKGFCVG